MRAVKLNKTTGQIQKAEYPRIPEENGTYLKLVGLDSNTEWLFEYEPTPPPVFDSRIYSLQPLEEVTNIPHPDHPLFNQYRITYTLVKKSNDEIKAAISDMEASFNQNVMPTDQRIKLLTIGLNLAFKKITGATYTTREQGFLTRLDVAATKILKNDTVMRAKIVEVDNNQIPDLDGANWEKI